MMAVSHVEVLVEEPSMEAALELLLPRVLGEATFKIHSYQCKDNLLKQLPDRLRGYAAWIPADYRIVVVVDRDDDDCHNLKKRLERISHEANLRTPGNAGAQPPNIVIRIAIEELEAWYFGDWNAVQKAYPKIPDHIPNKAKYSDPDAIAGGTWETLELIMKRVGYFRTGLRKIEAARAIAKHWQPEQNRSHSFRVFHEALQKMVSG
jgi:hypothetical protein